MLQDTLTREPVFEKISSYTIKLTFEHAMLMGVPMSCGSVCLGVELVGKSATVETHA